MLVEQQQQQKNSVKYNALFSPQQIVDICEASALRLDGHLFQV